MRKLDPTLTHLAWRYSQARLVRSGTGADTDIQTDTDTDRPLPEVADLAAIFTGDLADLEAAGFVPRSVKRHPAKDFTVATGSIAVARLPELEHVEHLLTTEASRPMQSELNRSVSEINADDVHDSPAHLKGAGVVVGVIDGGFDIHHQNFRKPDGTTRILAIWDQTIETDDADAQPGERKPANFTFGVEYDENRINAALTTDRRLVRTNDKEDDEVSGHGTHVLGIAAGDGSQAGNCRGTFVFVGVAPEAEIILVRLRSANFELGASSNLIDAFEWIWRHPRAAGKPIVVNLSQGDNMGAHDGTSAVEQSIEIETLVVAGHVVVKSAGNAGADHQHAEGTVTPAAPVTVNFEVRPRDRKDRHIDIWYRGAGRLDVQLIRPGGGAVAGRTSPLFSPGVAAAPWPAVPAAAANRRVQVVVTSEINHPINGAHRIHILLDPGSRARTPSGEWQLTLTNTGAVDATFDAWIERGARVRQDKPPHHEAPIFTSAHMTNAKTISVPGTTVGAITVGNYSQGTGFFNSTGNVDDSSSRGPTSDGRTKPDLSAPGMAIKSAAAEEQDNCCCDCCEDFYVNMDGTSMSAPHVTGVVALMLQKNPTLPASEVKRILMATARPHGGGTPQAPDNTIGAGKINALAAVDATPPPPQPITRGGGGGSGGGGGGAVVGGGGGGGGGGGSRPIPAVRAFDADRIGDFLVSDQGQLWAALVSSHLSEVRGLIATNRRVAGFWQLLSGPQIVRSATAFARTGDAIVLTQLDGTEIDRRAAGFLRVLAKYGSPRLRRDVERHGEPLLALGWDGVLALLAGQSGRAA